MNIRDLNKIIELDAYSLSLQLDIIFAIIEYFYISTINENDYFY